MLSKEEITVYGRVQGVGFRPFVAELAEELCIDGTVQNVGGIVEIYAKGKKEALDELVHRLSVYPPAAARVDRIERRAVSEEKKQRPEEKRMELKEENSKRTGFFIVKSKEKKDLLRFLPPDIATCPSCIQELFDKKNRRYRYPFISCTVCGPRFSIMERIPYDRDTITMRDFGMCRRCSEEYTAKGNIRRHAQTIACDDCGPIVRLYLRGTEGYLQGESAIGEAVKKILDGGIAAIKDIGGYHFAFDPNNRKPAQRLREFKNRECKPFAVMFRDISAVREYCEILPEEEELLMSDARPIVLLRKRDGKDFVPEICGESMRIGAMLPCNPLQHLILNEINALVMTSGNRGGEPILTEDDEMRRFMEYGVPDAMLFHNRRIEFGLDDSVYQVTDCGEQRVVQVIRRGRGLVPEPVVLPGKLKADTFAAGGDMKAVFALGRRNMAYLSGHFGDLGDVRAEECRRGAVYMMSRLLGIVPEYVICDRHPGYISVKKAEEDGMVFRDKAGTAVEGGLKKNENQRNQRLKHVQKIKGIFHHHAHIAAVIGEYALSGQVLGVAYDGTGYGEDGTIWGGEFLLCEADLCERVGHLLSVPLIGGDVSAKNSLITAYCYLFDAVQKGYLDKDELSGVLPEIQDHEKIIIERAVENRIQVTACSSMGRFFDAAAAVLGICNYNSYEGECPERMQAAAEQYEKRHLEKLRTDVRTCAGETMESIQKSGFMKISVKEENDIWIADSVQYLASLARRKRGGEDIAKLAYEFHLAAVEMTVRMCDRILEGREIKQIALGGGTMYNSFMLRRLIPELKKRGYDVYIGEKVPSGDGGLAYGQLVCGLDGCYG